jgi:hypothetical protein
LTRDDLGQRSFSRSGWTVKDERLYPIGFDGASEQLSRAENVRLANEFFEITGSHPRRERSLAKDALLLARRLIRRDQFCFRAEKLVESHRLKIP